MDSPALNLGTPELIAQLIEALKDIIQGASSITVALAPQGISRQLRQRPNHCRGWPFKYLFQLLARLSPPLKQGTALTAIPGPIPMFIMGKPDPDPVETNRIQLRKELC